MREPTNHRQRRLELMTRLEGAVAIVPTHSHQTRSYDTEFPFRPDSNFKYLTGCKEADAVLVLAPHHPEFQEILFVHPKDPVAEMWMGERLGPEKACEIFEVDACFSLDDFKTKLPEFLEGHAKVAMDFYTHKKHFEKVLKMMEKLNQLKKKKVAKPTEILSLGPIVGEMRLIKDATELAFMKSALEITGKAHAAAMAFSSPEKTEREVHALLKYIFQKEGAIGEAYESIVAAGNHANTLHYIKNDSALHEGDLLLIDAGSEVNVYASDITRTFPINGKFTKAQRDVYQVVLNAQKEAFNYARPGATLAQMHQATCKSLAQGLIDLGVFSDKSLDEVMEKELYKEFYPHGTGHWLGLDVHDTCPYFDEDFQDIEFKPGMVFTVEPGLYFRKDHTNLPQHLKGIGIRIEDDLVITATGYENMSAAIPKEISEVEEACTRDYRDYL